MEKIETIEAIDVEDSIITLKNESDLTKVYSLVKDNVNFIVSWKTGNDKQSKLIIANNLLAKIENNEISLVSKTKVK